MIQGSAPGVDSSGVSTRNHRFANAPSFRSQRNRVQSPDAAVPLSRATAADGANSPTLVVLPGLDGTDVFSRPFVARLPGDIHARVVCYPQAGPNGYTDLLALARAAVSDLPEFYVFGSSFGGPLAVLLAAAEPGRVKGLVLSATFVSAPRPCLARFRPPFVAPLVWVLRAVRRIPIWLRHPRDPLRRAKAETWSRVSARALAARARAALGVDVRQELKRLRAPVLSVSFGDDRVIPAACAAEVRGLCPSARAATLAGGHLAMFSDPAPLAAAVSGFIDAIEAARKAA